MEVLLFHQHTTLVALVALEVVVVLDLVILEQAQAEQEILHQQAHHKAIMVVQV
jgi:hypothetical protein